MISAEVIEKVKWDVATRNSWRELCGVVTVDDQVIFVTNVSKNPCSFAFDRKEYFGLLNSGVEVKCIFHSHPEGEVEPSVHDMETFVKLGFDMLIVSGSKHKYIEKRAE